MNYFHLIIILCQIFCSSSEYVAHTDGNHTDNLNEKSPTVLIVALFRNKAHTMPYFLNYLDRLDYPKERISFLFRSDHNEDESLQVLYNWLSSSAYKYHQVNIEYEDNEKRRKSETSATHWPEERHLDVIRLKEEGLQYARNIWADYVFFLDADAFLTRSTILQDLIALKKPIIAPMLFSDGLYSNFWCGMTNDYYYQRTSQYKEIYNLEERGDFDVPMVHSAVLINLNDKRSDMLTFNKTTLSERFLLKQHETDLIPTDDIIIFALSANYSQLPLTITNRETYGYVTVPLDHVDNFEKDFYQLTNIKIMILSENDLDALTLPREMEKFVSYPQADAMTLDRIFMINLDRRVERRLKMNRSFKEIGLEVEHIPAIDGQELTDKYLEEIGVRFLPGYADPFHNRPMTKGEIGCFLSHFLIWEKMVVMKLKEVLVLEDDIRFEPYFKERALSLLEEARQIGGWDLIYFGRKRMVNQDEKWVENSAQLIHAGYSYWTLGYVLSLDGAKKLLAARPLENLIPVDEFLPVMFNQHLNESWKRAFPNRNLVAWSAAPLLLFPTHYTGEDGYFSDTEESDLITLKESDDKSEKKGNKENLDSLVKSDNAENTATESILNDNQTIDTQFLVNKVNEHNTMNPSSDTHSEL